MVVDHLRAYSWNLGDSLESAREVDRRWGCAVGGESGVPMDALEEIVEWELRLSSEGVRPPMVGPEMLYAHDDEQSHHGHCCLRARQTLTVDGGCCKLMSESQLALQVYDEAPQGFWGWELKLRPSLE